MTLSNIACIVLAAGGSKRFGSPKQVQPFKGEALVRRAVRAAYDSGADSVLLVTGAHAEQVTTCVSDFASLRIAHNSSWSKGLASSIATGVSALESERLPAGVLVTLGDQPLVDGACLRRLVNAFDDAHRVVAASYNDTVGAPVLFGIEYAGMLKELSGDWGARKWLQSLDNLTTVAMPQAALDIDEVEDLVERD